MPDTIRCKNCDRFFDKSYAYCPHCGQEAADNLTFGVLFSNTISNYFSVDARFFRSFIPLMLKPGTLARRFVDGKRLSYLHPAQFYLFISVIFFFLFSFSVRKADNFFNKSLQQGFEQEMQIDTISTAQDSIARETAVKALRDNQIYMRLSDEDMNQLDSIIVNEPVVNMSFGLRRRQLDSLIATGATQEEKLRFMGMEEDAGSLTQKFYAQVLKLYEQKAGGIFKTIVDTIPIAMFFMLPLFAFLLKLVYWKRGTFAHHMVFSFYFFTFIFTAFSVLMVANMIFDGLPSWLQSLYILSFVIYLIIALRNFYQKSWIGALFKGVTVWSAYLFFMIPIAMIGLIIVGFWTY